MKKLMFTLAALAVAFTSAQAQKQMGDEHNIEVSFNPFSGSPIDASVIKYRKFLDDDAALRVTLGISNEKNSYLMAPENTLTNTGVVLTHGDLSLYNTFSHLDLSVGYEKHFRGTDNLSPYVAFAVGYGRSTTTLEREHFSAVNLEDAEEFGQWRDEEDVATWNTWSYMNTIQTSEVNLNLMFGADYYFNDAIYVGFEAGLRGSRNLGVTSKISAENAVAFNMYFDGGEGVGNDDDFVQFNLDDAGNYQWVSDTPVDYTINSDPWIGDGASSDALAPQGAYLAADNLWSDWNDQGPDNLDNLASPARDALFSGANSLGTYSTGMLRVGFLFN